MSAGNDNDRGTMPPAGAAKRKWHWAIAAILVAMVALAAWAWWIPDGGFVHWIARARAFFHR